MAMSQQPDEGIRHFLARLRGRLQHIVNLEYVVVHVPKKYRMLTISLDLNLLMS